MKRLVTPMRLAMGTLVLCLMAAVAPSAGVGAQNGNSDYDRHLALIKSQSVRNHNLDGRPQAQQTQAELDISDDSPMLGERSEYLNVPNGNPSHSFPTEFGGNFRVECEFSHFAYDDPLVSPGQPGAAHLHMFFGNTDVNAYSTVDTLKNSGSSTCNGQELNRTGYWAPAMIDGDGNARIPERVVVYYKGYGRAQGDSLPYEDGMANISPMPLTVPEVPISQGGAEGSRNPQVNYKCSNNRSLNPTDPGDMGVNTIPTCSGDRFAANYPEYRTVLEMDIKFWNCFDAGANPTSYEGWEAGGSDGWFGSQCADETYPNLEYFINYVVEPGEDTSDWYLASDVDPATIGSNPTLRGQQGATHHGDWWGAWHPEINDEWLRECVNFSITNVRTGCGMGYLSNGGPQRSPSQQPLAGRALKYREQYDKQIGQSQYYKVPVAELFAELCSPLQPSHQFTVAESGAWCKPPGSGGNPTPTCNGQMATIVGTADDDVLAGTTGPDVIWSGSGNDTIYGAGGNDVVCSGPGNDRVYSGPGNDWIAGGNDDDELFGNSGNDWIAGGGGDDRIFGGHGDDETFGGNDNDMLWGGPGNDLVTGGLDDDRGVGGDGNDRVTGGPGNDRLFGSNGNDYLAGDANNDFLRGGAGIDTCDGGDGSDQASGNDCETVRNIG